MENLNLSLSLSLSFTGVETLSLWIDSVFISVVFFM